MELINDNNTPANTAPARNTSHTKAENTLNIKDFLFQFINKWYWFVISLAITISAAVFHLLSTPSVYTRSATILIKDDSKSGSSKGGDMVDKSFFRSNTNINNELQTLKSSALMNNVVERLKLNETYTVKSGLRTQELYNTSPVVVTTGSRTDKHTLIAFTITLDSDKEFTLSDFIGNNGKVSGSVKGKIGIPVHTPTGTVTLSKTKNYASSYLNTPIRFVRSSIQGMGEAYAARLNAILGSDKTTIINLTISDYSPAKAEDILNTLIQVYNENWILDKNQIAVSTSQFINERLNVIEKELGNVDESISNYKSEHLLTDVNSTSNLYMNQSVESKRELTQLNDQLTMARHIRKELGKKSLTYTLPSGTGLENDNIQGLIGEYNTLVLDRNQLLTSSGENNPLVRDMENSLRSLQNSILQSIDNLITSLTTRQQSLQQQELASTRQLASTPGQAKYLLSVERKQKVKEELYLTLLQKREENELSQAFTAYNTRILTAPHGSMAPTAPNKSFILIIAVAIGLLIPAVIIIITIMMNDKVRGRQDITHLQIPFAGEIPLAVKKGEKKPKTDDFRIMVKDKSKNIINEAFRVIRTNLEFMIGQDEHKVIMVSSLNPGSGKTFITINLTISLAIKQKKVMVIDLDLRRGSLSKYIGKPHLGISNYLSGQVDDWRSLIKHADTEISPDILPVGTIPPNPTELLFSPRMEKIIQELRQEYDYIFFDCPPVEIVADASIINKWTDLTLFVVRAGLLERDKLSVIEGFYEERKYGNMALLLNGTESSYGKYGYRYGYRYGYNYGYGHYTSE